MNLIEQGLAFLASKATPRQQRAPGPYDSRGVLGR